MQGSKQNKTFIRFHLVILNPYMCLLVTHTILDSMKFDSVDTFSLID